MTSHFQTHWIDTQAARNRDPRHPMDKMAEMVWQLEEEMNSKAREVWPSPRAGHKVTFPRETQARLKWLGILRRNAWSTFLRARDIMQADNIARGARGRVVAQSKGIIGFRIGRGELWTMSNTLEIIIRSWRRITRWLQTDKEVKLTISRATKEWEKEIERTIEQARRDKDDRRVWQLMRVLGRTGIRERKRCTKDVKRDDPTPREWMLSLIHI